MSEWDGTKIAAETIIGMGMLGTAEKGLVDQLINDGSDEIARLREALIIISNVASGEAQRVALEALDEAEGKS